MGFTSTTIDRGPTGQLYDVECVMPSSSSIRRWRKRRSGSALASSSARTKAVPGLVYRPSRRRSSPRVEWKYW